LWNINNMITSKINELGNWLLEDSGLELKDKINDILDDIKTNIGEAEITKYTNGANLLRLNGNISDMEHRRFIDTLPNKKLVYIAGEWHPVNKLNTNYSDVSQILNDLLYESKNEGELPSIEIIDVIRNIKNVFDRKHVDYPKNIESMKNILSSNKDHIKGLFDRYISTPDQLLGYTNNVKKNSEWGEKVENEVVKTLLSIPGYKLLYKGGDGDFIDMIFSVDLIFKSPTNQTKTIQVKSGKRDALKFINKGRNGAVDILIYPINQQQFEIYSFETKTTKTINRLNKK
jgi:hypothetical protein